LIYIKFELLLNQSNDKYLNSFHFLLLDKVKLISYNNVIIKFLTVLTSVEYLQVSKHQ